MTRCYQRTVDSLYALRRLYEGLQAASFYASAAERPWMALGGQHEVGNQSGVEVRIGRV